MKNKAGQVAAVFFAVLLAATLVAQQPVRVVSWIALATGSNAIGKLTANSGVDIGDVTVDNATLAVTQSGTWTVTGSGGTFPVTGTFWQATQPVSGTVAATQSGTWDEVGINDSGNSLTVDGVNLDVQIGGSDSLIVGTFPDNEPFNMAQRGGVAIVSDPCEREARIFVDIDQTSGEELVNGTASERVVICSFFVVSATAQGVALVSGTGTVCATSITAVLGFGGASAATGQQLSANGGWVNNNAGKAIGQTTADDDNVCLLQSGAGQVSGGLSYVSLVP